MFARLVNCIFEAATQRDCHLRCKCRLSLDLDRLSATSKVYPCYEEPALNLLELIFEHWAPKMAALGRLLLLKTPVKRQWKMPKHLTAVCNTQNFVSHGVYEVSLREYRVHRRDRPINRSAEYSGQFLPLWINQHWLTSEYTKQISGGESTSVGQHSFVAVET